MARAPILRHCAATMRRLVTRWRVKWALRHATGRRVVFGVAFFLIIGALLNIGICWSFVVWGSVGSITVQIAHDVAPNSQDSWIAEGPMEWPLSVPAHWPPPQLLFSARGLGIIWVDGISDLGHPAARPGHRVSAVCCGFPFYSLEWKEGFRVDEQLTEVRTFGGRWIRLPPKVGPLLSFARYGTKVERRLPIDPIWPGLLLNSSLYAAIAYGVTFGAVQGRRLVRRRRGRCPMCAYDLAGITADVCPECGKPTGREA